MAGEDDELAELIGELVSIETNNPPGNEGRCARFVRDWFEERGIESTLVHEPFEDRPQVVGRAGSTDPTVVFNGHLDVVPAGDKSRWKYDPYNGTIDDGRLYGRGSVDMKTGIALGMLTTARLAPEIERGDVDGSILFQGAIGGESAEPGTRTLLEQGYDGDYAVVLEPTGLRTATSEKGTAWYRIDVFGEPVHASRPDQGCNAIEEARALMSAIDDYDEELRSRENELVGQAFATVTQFHAGTKENVLPEEASLVVDRRILPEESVDTVDAEVDAVLADLEGESGVRTEWERTRTYRPAHTDPNGPLAAAFRERSHEVAGVTTDPLGLVVSTDLSHFAEFGVEGIVWGPGEMTQAHTLDESMSLAEATTGLEILRSTVSALLSAK